MRCTFSHMNESQIRVAANRVRNTGRGLVFASSWIPWVSYSNIVDIS